MSEFYVKVIRVGPVTKHPGADNLSITDVTGYPVILRTGDFVEGDKAVYVPIDAIVPEQERWAFEALGIEKFEPEEPAEGNLRDPGFMPIYTDIVGLRPNPDILVDGEEVVITEKIHGECARYTYVVDVPPPGVLVDSIMATLWAGSRTNIKDPEFGSHWWKVAERLDLRRRLAEMQGGAARGIAIYGEVFGDVSGMKYDATSDKRDLRLFDALDTKTRTYLDFDDFLRVAEKLALPIAPVLYRGPWSHDLRKLAEGNSQLADHVREGFVVRPVKERWDQRIGRVILKLHGEGFLLRKG